MPRAGPLILFSLCSKSLVLGWQKMLRQLAIFDTHLLRLWWLDSLPTRSSPLSLGDTDLNIKILILIFKSVPRAGLEPAPACAASPSSWCVCQFHHLGSILSSYIIKSKNNPFNFSPRYLIGAKILI